MKPHYKPLATALAANLQLAALAAVPLAWDVRPGQPAPVMFDRYHGETIDFAATFRGFGELPFAPGADIRLWFQTNGMGSAWWSVPATISSNVLSATWSPALDPGADRVSLFFGAPSNAYASAVLRLRHSPGFAPGTMPDPESFHEADPEFTAWLSAFSESDPVFSSWLSTFEIPETSLDPATNYTDRALSSFAATGTVFRSVSYGTPTRWTDATGCVWEVNTGWRIYTNGVVAAGWTAWNYPYDSVEDGIFWSLMIGLDEDAGSLTYAIANQTLPSGTTPQWDSELTTIYYGDMDYKGIMPGDSVRAVRGETNLVGRVALTNDIPGAITSTISEFAATGTVHAAESSTYSSRLFDASYDSAYDATYLIRESTNAAQAVMAPLATTVNAWETYWGGSNVVFEVTNYYGNTSGDLPRLRIREYKDDTWQTVWDEANKFVVCESNILRQVAASNAAVLAEADGKFLGKAWGTYTDKGSTNIVGNSVWMTSPETYFAGGTEYQRVAVGSGAICVLMDRGALLKTAGEPGTFRFQDDGGTNYFGFTKSDSYTIGCNTDGITVSGTLVTLRYDVIMAGTDVPIVYWREYLTSGSWAQLNNSDGSAADGAPYTVTWYTSGGAYYAAINCGENATGFFKAETSVMGDVVFETNMKASFLNGLVCTNTATSTMGVIRPSYNGSSVTWTWSAR